MIKTGEIYWSKISSLNAGGSVQKNVRPVLITTNQIGLDKSNICSVIPLTAKIEKLNRIPSHILIKDLSQPSVLLTEQIATIPQSEIIGNPIAKIDDGTMQLVKRAVNLQLGFTA